MITGENTINLPYFLSHIVQIKHRCKYYFNLSQHLSIPYSSDKTGRKASVINLRFTTLSIPYSSDKTSSPVKYSFKSSINFLSHIVQIKLYKTPKPDE